MSVRHAMLALLSEGPKYGLQLRGEEDDTGRDLSMLLAVDAELFRLDSVVRWLDTAEARVDRAAADPAMAGTGQASRRDQISAPLPRRRREVGVRR